MVAQRYRAIVSDYYVNPQWEHPFIDDFAAARNISWRALPEDTDWVFILDTDDVMQDCKAARELVLKHETPGLGFVKIMNSEGDGQFLQPRFWSYGDAHWEHRMHEQLEKDIEELPHIFNDKILIIHDYESIDKSNREERNQTLARAIIADGEVNMRFSFFFAEKLYINNLKEGVKEGPELQEAVKTFKEITAGPIGKKDSIIVFKSFYFLSDYYSISKERDYVEAVRYGLEALKYNLDDGRPYFTIGRSLYSMGHYEQAIVWLEHAMNLPEALGPFPIFNAFKTYLPIEQIAFCYLKLGKKEKAQGYHSRARYIHKEYEKHDKDFD
jgi:tetratricopeptide (TPR) repeat protein